ncbi:MAG: triacylglycerol lipase [Leptolyngbyaceae cyanobacterium SL_5_9]|nr:triacylglycerol lipase [Leptolyngbyaceae cyanobacterium SL_5_9]NJO73104.1 triacylglycerol lipase [Leptolyngbyaceae cyanobacterium RM1_406_9]
MSASTSRNPVLLVHGIDDTAILFNRMTTYLQQQGWTVHSLDLIPNNGSVGLDRLAHQVARYIEQNFAPDQPIDLIGFSMGGIVSRYYVQRLGGIDRVQRFITISSPHNGTWTAYFRPNLGGNQMQRNSAFLYDLNQDVAALAQINFTSIWTPMDLMILPAVSSRLPVGREVILSVPSHPQMVTDARCLKAIADALSEPLRVLPRPDLPLEQTLPLQK